MSTEYAMAAEIYAGRHLDYSTEVRFQEAIDGTVTIHTWNVQGVTEPTIAQLESIWAAQGTAYLAQLEQEEKDFTLQYKKLEKAFSLVVLDEINTMRTWLRDFKTEVSLSTSLANFQSRIAALPAMADRTIAQLKQAVKDKYNTL